MRWQGRFFKRVFTRVGLMLALGMLLVCVLTWQIMQRWLTGFTSDQLANDARLARLVVSQRWPYHSNRELQSHCDEIHQLTGLRVTVIQPDGVVVADSEMTAATMENHAHRPEIEAALRGELGQDTRQSSSTGHPYIYIAVPL